MVCSLPPCFDGDQPALPLEGAEHLEVEPDTQGDVFNIHFRSSERRASYRILLCHVDCVEEDFDARGKLAR